MIIIIAYLHMKSYFVPNDFEIRCDHSRIAITKVILLD